ncbi:MAG: ScnB-like protein [Pseudomonadota bacterium]
MAEKVTHVREDAEGRAVHDVGGLDFGPIDRTEHDLALWERRTDAMQRILSSPAKGIFSVDALRRTIEDYGEQQYDATTYYEKWIRALRNLCLEQGVVDQAELDAKIAEVRAAFEAEGRGAADGIVPDDGRGTA